MVLWVYERSRAFVRSVSLGKASVLWLLDIMRALLQAESSKEFVEFLRMGIKAFIAQHGSHRFGCFLAVAECGGGGRRGFVVILEGRGGRGWLDFVLKLQRFLEAFQMPYGRGQRAL